MRVRTEYAGCPRGASTGSRYSHLRNLRNLRLPGLSRGEFEFSSSLLLFFLDVLQRIVELRR